MATRLYLPASGTAPLADLAVDTNWELSTSLARLPCFTWKTNTALALTQLTWGAELTQQWCWKQYQSPPMDAGYSWTTSDTVSMVIGKCAEAATTGDTHLAYVVRVVSGDGLTIRGVVGLFHGTSTEFPKTTTTQETRIHSARTDGASNFTSYSGDRIIIEIGLHGATPTLVVIDMKFGDPSATADFALTEGLTTDLCPWVSLSRDVSFGGPTASDTIALAEAPAIVTGSPNRSTSETVSLTEAPVATTGSPLGSALDSVSLTEFPDAITGPPLGSAIDTISIGEAGGTPIVRVSDLEVIVEQAVPKEKK